MVNKTKRDNKVSKWQEEKRLVLETSQKMLERGLVVGNPDNVTLHLPPRDSRELLAITPTSRCYDLLAVDDIQVIDFETEPVEGDLPPSSKTLLHTGIYPARQDMNVVIHIAVFAGAISVAGLAVPTILDD